MPDTMKRVATSALLLVVTGCGALDVTNPTTIDGEDVNNATSAALLRDDVLRQLYQAVVEGARAGGLLADEFLATPGQYGDGDRELDQRESMQLEQVLATQGGGVYRSWQLVRRAGDVAAERLRASATTPEVRAVLGEALALRGFATLRLAEDFCPGFPLNDVVNYGVVYGPPLTTEEVFQRALIDFDSALVHAADSTRILNFTRVARARALLGMGRLADAAASATAVPTAFVANAEYSSTFGFWNFLFSFFGGAHGRRNSMADQDGGTGLNFISAQDPRLPATFVAMAFDGVTPVHRAGKYAATNTPIVMASGIEARLIEAEAALHANPDQPQWLMLLNALRTSGSFSTRPNAQDPARTDTLWNPGTGGVAGLAPLNDPGPGPSRVDLLFRERAFWLYGTGHRLADLRRLVVRYDRSIDEVFPTGPYRLGGVYGSATSIPFPAELEAPYNPAITGCTSR